MCLNCILHHGPLWGCDESYETLHKKIKICTYIIFSLQYSGDFKIAELYQWTSR